MPRARGSRTIRLQIMTTATVVNANRKCRKISDVQERNQDGAKGIKAVTSDRFYRRIDNSALINPPFAVVRVKQCVDIAKSSRGPYCIDNPRCKYGHASDQTPAANINAIQEMNRLRSRPSRSAIKIKA